MEKNTVVALVGRTLHWNSKHTFSSSLLNTLGNLGAEGLRESDVALLEDAMEELRSR